MEAQRSPTAIACLTAIEIALFLQSVIVNGGVESIDDNPMLGPRTETLYLCGALLLDTGQYWRLLTCIFLHAGVLHVLPNMCMQWWVGVAVESRWGAWWVMLLYVLSGLSGALASAALGGPKRISLGASGALYGLLAAGAAGDTGELGWPHCIKVRIAKSSGRRTPGGRQGEEGAQDPATPHGGSVSAWFGWRLIVLSLVISLFLGLALPSVDTWAHLGGMVMGFAVAGARGRGPGGLLRALQGPRRTAEREQQDDFAYRPVIRTIAVILGLGSVGACGYLLACDGCIEPPGGVHDLLKVLI